jgi:flagellin-specific chaperone FliS
VTPLVYQSTRLAKLGTLISSEITTEIDQLLTYCNNNLVRANASHKAR